MNETHSINFTNTLAIDLSLNKVIELFFYCSVSYLELVVPRGEFFRGQILRSKYRRGKSGALFTQQNEVKLAFFSSRKYMEMNWQHPLRLLEKNLAESKSRVKI